MNTIVRNITLTRAEITVIADALQFAIDNGLADDYEDTETLYRTCDMMNVVDGEDE